MPFLGKAPGVSTVTVSDDAITTAKIADNAITSAKIGVDVIVAEDLAANSITVSEITDDAVTQAKIADDAVDEARLQISNSGTNGHALTYQSGNTGKLTWAAMSGGVSGITSSADGTAMTIDSSERIVMPSQPMFCAHSVSAITGGSLHSEANYIYNEAGATSGTARAVSFHNVMVNVGSHWSNTTGYFTAPVAGRYLVYWNVNWHGNDSWPNAMILQNAHLRAISYTNHAQSAETYSNIICATIINAAVNDKIWPAYNGSYNSPTVGASGYTWGYNQCLIMLLG